MSKLHPIETCVGCGNQIRPLIRENKEEWEDFRNFMIERPTIAKEMIMDILTPRAMVHEEADIIYFLCANCCRAALSQLLTQVIARHRRILFWDFDKLRKELKE